MVFNSTEGNFVVTLSTATTSAIDMLVVVASRPFTVTSELVAISSAVTAFTTALSILVQKNHQLPFVNS